MWFIYLMPHIFKPLFVLIYFGFKKIFWEHETRRFKKLHTFWSKVLTEQDCQQLQIIFIFFFQICNRNPKLIGLCLDQILIKSLGKSPRGRVYTDQIPFDNRYIEIGKSTRVGLDGYVWLQNQRLSRKWIKFRE